MESSVVDTSQTKCNEHPTQLLMLFCLDDQTKLCLKCVAKHGGHNIYDFEDVCTKIIQPKLESVKDSQMLTLESLKSGLGLISQRNEELTSLELLRTKNLNDLAKLITEEVKTQVQEQIDQGQNFLNRKEDTTLDDIIFKLKQRRENIENKISEQDTMLKLFEQAEYLKILDAYYNLNQPQNDGNNSYLQREDAEELELLQNKALEKIKQTSELLKTELIVDKEKIKKDVALLIQKSIKVINIEENKSSLELKDALQDQVGPELFFIDTDMNMLKYYDFKQRQILTKMIKHIVKIPLFMGIGFVQKRIFMFGGKQPHNKKVSNKSYELKLVENNINSESNMYKLVQINRMIKNRSRMAIASIDRSINKFSPFIVIVGGADEFSAINMCELYYPAKDCYYAFPSLNQGRENSSVCLIKNRSPDLATGIKQEQNWLYVFGGFGKNGLETIERVKIEFDPSLEQHPVVTGEWELLKNISLFYSLECCGTFQYSEHGIMIFGGFHQRNEDNQQLILLDLEKFTIIGVNSYLKQADCFVLPSVVKDDVFLDLAREGSYLRRGETPLPNEDQKQEEEEEKKVDQQRSSELDNSRQNNDYYFNKNQHLYAWSLDGHLHKMNFKNFVWDIINEESDREPQSQL